MINLTYSSFSFVVKHRVACVCVCGGGGGVARGEVGGGGGRGGALVKLV